MPLRPYPAPPWRTRAFAVAAAFTAPRGAVRPPEGLAASTPGGRHAGVLAYVEYVPPSPLCYREIVWMPTRVRHAAGESTWTGSWVRVMAVDCEAALAAGREVWALPKERARFERTPDGVRVEADAGWGIALRFHPRGPAVPLAGRAATLQVRGDEVVQFRARFRGRVAWAAVQVETSDGLLGEARPVPGAGAVLRHAATVMLPPRARRREAP